MATSTKDLFVEACRIPSRNPKLAALVFVVCLVLHLLLYLVQYTLTSTLLSAEQIDRIVANVAALASPQVADHREGLIRKVKEDAKGPVIFLVAAWIATTAVAALRSIVVVHWADTARFQKQLAPKDFVPKLGKACKGTIVTLVSIDALCLCYVGFVMCVFAAAAAAVNFSMPLAFGLVVMDILALVPLVFGVAVACVATVTSVVEDGCYGFGAIGKAWKVLKGRRMQGCVLSLAIFGINISIYLLRGWLSSMLGKDSLVLGLVWLCLAQVMVMLNMAVFTVFYRDCQESRGQFAGLELHYDKLSTGV